jgi:hypothetical protein
MTSIAILAQRTGAARPGSSACLEGLMMDDPPRVPASGSAFVQLRSGV